MRTAIAIMAALLVTPPAHAQPMPMPLPATAPCPAPAAPPPELAGWATRTPLAAASHRGGLPAAALTPGRAADVRLVPVARVAFLTPPAKPGGPASYAGLLAFAVRTPGTYRVALGGGAWVDVIAGGKPLASIAHGHGPACTGIAKTVDFTLAPGAYALQLAGSATPALAVMIASLTPAPSPPPPARVPVPRGGR